MTQYPKLEKAVKEVAYDNGCVNRFNAEEDVVRKAMGALVTAFHPGELQVAEDFLAPMTDDQLIEFASDGEEDPRSHGNIMANTILNYAFDHL